MDLSPMPKQSGNNNLNISILKEVFQSRLGPTAWARIIFINPKADITGTFVVSYDRCIFIYFGNEFINSFDGDHG